MAQAKIRRNGRAVWKKDLKNGRGDITTGSGALSQNEYSFGTRFGDEPGTNPEELIAAAHAACFSMALANTLDSQGYNPEEVDTKATCTLTPKDGGFEITNMKLEVTGRVKGVDQRAFEAIVREADKGCPVSNLLRNGLDIELNAVLIQAQPIMQQ
jgi:osmotically inducible protein OsmC